MLAPLLAVAMIQNPPLPAKDRGSALYANCLATLRIMDNPSTPEKDIDGANTCLDYVQGFDDAANLLGAPICINGSSLGTLIRVYVNFMQAHPKWMDVEKGYGLYAAMQDAYPCKAN